MCVLKKIYPRWMYLYLAILLDTDFKFWANEQGFQKVLPGFFLTCGSIILYQKYVP